MANPRGQQRDKPFRDALRMEIAEAADDRRDLRRIARALLEKAASGDVMAAKEVGDRLDGKVPQAIVGDDEHGPVRLEQIQRVIVDPNNSDSESVPTAPGTEPV